MMPNQHTANIRELAKKLSEMILAPSHILVWNALPNLSVKVGCSPNHFLPEWLFEPESR
jgi:hypothetical protein